MLCFGRQSRDRSQTPPFPVRQMLVLGTSDILSERPIWTVH